MMFKSHHSMMPGFLSCIIIITILYPRISNALDCMDFAEAKNLRETCERHIVISGGPYHTTRVDHRQGYDIITDTRGTSPITSRQANGCTFNEGMWFCMWEFMFQLPPWGLSMGTLIMLCNDSAPNSLAVVVAMGTISQTVKMLWRIGCWCPRVYKKDDIKTCAGGGSCLAMDVTAIALMSTIWKKANDVHYGEYGNSESSSWSNGDPPTSMVVLAAIAFSLNSIMLINRYIVCCKNTTRSNDNEVNIV